MLPLRRRWRSGQRQTDENLWDPSIGIDDTCSSSSLQKDLASHIKPSWFSKGSDAENLVKAFVAKDETSSSRSDNIESSITSSSQFPASFKQLKFEACAPIGSGSVTWNQPSALLARGATPASFTDRMSTLVDEEQHGKGYKLKCYTQQEAPRSNNMSEATSGCENGISRTFHHHLAFPFLLPSEDAPLQVSPLHIFHQLCIFLCTALLLHPPPSLASQLPTTSKTSVKRLAGRKALPQTPTLRPSSSAPCKFLYPPPKFIQKNILKKKKKKKRDGGSKMGYIPMADQKFLVVHGHHVQKEKKL
ncbi:hypothetical protein ACFX15_045810 [Malus domestica]